MADLQNIGVIATVGGVFIAVMGVIGKWIAWSIKQALREASSGTREVLGKQIAAVKTTVEDKIDRHEDIDQTRHEQNLEQFKQIAVRLARMGNGSTDSAHH